ncbi:CerR family C-terminal domain-containing protein [Sphingomonas sp. AOB5]|uniref:CerR family C-terminal domain-containing protein n=1 Tax=Sphingomonas sp. AOB5 TaxID=3034017 RepID=UPI0023F6D3C0|nr:CerR family C-terminal domain-containing protein [Sphingomonas sp. AOB5]MDF7777207.1 CerR family C-terminal domain-containing protein [Sphingomonas sp. AOB5]
MSEATRASTTDHLLTIAIDRFGRAGLEGASTRDIAGAAGKPLSAITYHFGGKEGLYLAAAEHIAGQIRGWIGPALAMSHEICAEDGDPAAARAALQGILGAAVAIMTRDETEAFARFIIREQAEPTEAFNILYDGVMGPASDRVCALLQCAAGGRLDPAEARLRTLMLIGQVLMFRVCRATVLRGMGWSDIGPAEQIAIRRIATDHLDAILDRLAKGDPA